jgi:BlaI family transcriptional regulator, penicillinase repressor
MKKTEARGLTPAQMEVMELVWQRGQVGVAEAWKALSERRPIARNTVQTTLARLHERGWLRATEEGNAFVYAAARGRQSVVARMIDRLVDTAFGGSHSDLVAAIVESPRLSGEEAERIRAIINGAAPKRAGKRK